MTTESSAAATRKVARVEACEKKLATTATVNQQAAVIFKLQEQKAAGERVELERKMKQQADLLQPCRNSSTAAERGLRSWKQSWTRQKTNL